MGDINVSANGKSFSFPDGTSQQQIGEAVDSYFSGKAAPASAPQPAANPLDEYKKKYLSPNDQSDPRKLLDQMMLAHVTGQPAPAFPPGWSEVGKQAISREMKALYANQQAMGQGTFETPYSGAGPRIPVGTVNGQRIPAVNPLPQSMQENAAKSKGAAGALKRFGVGMADPQSLAILPALGGVGPGVTRAVGAGMFASQAPEMVRRYKSGDVSGALTEAGLYGAIPLLGEASIARKISKLEKAAAARTQALAEARRAVEELNYQKSLIPRIGENNPPRPTGPRPTLPPMSDVDTSQPMFGAEGAPTLGRPPFATTLRPTAPPAEVIPPATIHPEPLSLQQFFDSLAERAQQAHGEPSRVSGAQPFQLEPNFRPDETRMPFQDWLDTFQGKGPLSAKEPFTTNEAGVTALPGESAIQKLLPPGRPLSPEEMELVDWWNRTNGGIDEPPAPEGGGNVPTEPTPPKPTKGPQNAALQQERVDGTAAQNVRTGEGGPTAAGRSAGEGQGVGGNEPSRTSEPQVGPEGAGAADAAAQVRARTNPAQSANKAVGKPLPPHTTDKGRPEKYNARGFTASQEKYLGEQLRAAIPDLPERAQPTFNKSSSDLKSGYKYDELKRVGPTALDQPGSVTIDVPGDGRFTVAGKDQATNLLKAIGQPVGEAKAVKGLHEQLIPPTDIGPQGTPRYLYGKHDGKPFVGSSHLVFFDEAEAAAAAAKAGAREAKSGLATFEADLDAAKNAGRPIGMAPKHPRGGTTQPVVFEGVNGQKIPFDKRLVDAVYKKGYGIRISDNPLAPQAVVDGKGKVRGIIMGMSPATLENMQETIPYVPPKAGRGIRGGNSEGGAFDASIIVDMGKAIAHGAKLVAEKVTDAAKWAAEMVKAFGEAVRPHLASIWEKVTDPAKKGWDALFRKPGEVPYRSLKDIAEIEKSERWLEGRNRQRADEMRMFDEGIEVRSAEDRDKFLQNSKERAARYAERDDMAGVEAEERYQERVKDRYEQQKADRSVRRLFNKRGALDIGTQDYTRELWNAVDKNMDAWVQKVFDEYGPEMGRHIVKEMGPILSRGATGAAVSAAGRTAPKEKEADLPPDPLRDKALQMIADQKKGRRQQQALYSEALAQKAERLGQRQQASKSFPEFVASEGALAGELPKVGVENRHAFDAADLDEIMNRIRFHPDWQGKGGVWTQNHAAQAVARWIDPARKGALQPSEISLLQKLFGDEVAREIPTGAEKFHNFRRAWRFFNMMSNPKSWLVVQLTGNSLNAGMKFGEAALRNPRSVPARVAGAVSGMAEASSDFMKIWKTGTLKEEVPGIDYGHTDPAGGGLKNPMNWVSRGPRAIDQFFYKVAYHSEMAAQVVNKAKGDPEAIARFTEKPSAEMEAAADSYAREAVFRLQKEGDFPDAMRYLQKFKQTGAAGEVLDHIVPFLMFASENARQGLNRTPGIGALRLLTKEGRANAPQVLSEQLGTGSLLAVTGYMMAKSGRVNGAVPQDKEKWAQFYREGRMPWSATIYVPGVGERTVPLQYFGPMAFPFIMGAAIEDYRHDKGVLSDREVSNISASLGKFAIDQTNMRGAASFLDALSTGKVDRITADLISQYIPASGLQRGITFATDDVIRDPDGVLERLKAQTPVASKQVKPMEGAAPRTGGGIDQITNALVMGGKAAR